MPAFTKTTASLAGLFVLIAGFLFLTWNSVSHGPYIYDEADYLSAASRGVVANAFETGSTPVIQLIKIALNSRGSGGRASLSEWVRNSNDVSFYRHWHGPLGFYYLMLVGVAGQSEFFHRVSMLVFPLLTLLVTWFTCWRLLPESMKFGGAALTTALVAWNFVATRSSEIAPHQLYAFAAIVSVVLLTLGIQTAARRYWYASVTFAALAILTLEIGFVLIFFLLLMAWIERKSLHTSASMLAKSAALYLGVILVLWPAAILQLSIVKAYMSLVYISIYRKPWGNMTLLGAWQLRIEHSPVQWFLFVPALVLFVLWRDLPVRRVALPFLLFGGLTLLVLARVANDTARYDLPYFQAFNLFTGLVLTAAIWKFKPLVRNLAIAGTAAACLFTTWIAMQSTREITPSPVPQVLEAVRRDGLASASILAPQDLVPVLHYYFPESRVRGYRDAAPTSDDWAAAAYDAIVEPGNRVEKLH
jgi:hypothetical protein